MVSLGAALLGAGLAGLLAAVFLHQVSGPATLFSKAVTGPAYPRTVRLFVAMSVVGLAVIGASRVI